MLSTDQVSGFGRDGFVLGSRILDPAHFPMLREEVLRVIDERDNATKPQPVLLRNLSTDDAPVWQIVNIWQASEAFRELAHNRMIAEEVAQLTGRTRAAHLARPDPVQAGRQGRRKSVAPGFALLADAHAEDQQVTAWVALDDVDERERLHEHGRRFAPMGRRDRRRREAAEIRVRRDGRGVGDATRVVRAPAHCQDVSGSRRLRSLSPRADLARLAANNSDRPRRAIALHYMTEKTVFVASGSHPMGPFIHVADGAKIEGEAFPLVFEQKDDVV